MNCTGSPTFPSGYSGPSTGTSCRCSRGSWTVSGPRPGPPGWPAWGSIPGESTTACSTRKAPCSGTRCTTGTAGPTGCPAGCSAGSRRTSSTRSPASSSFPSTPSASSRRRPTPELAAARTLLMIPDLLSYWLTGEIGAEVTNASTTQLYDVRAQAWATSLMARVGIPPGIFPPLRRPGDTIGRPAARDRRRGRAARARARAGGRLARHGIGGRRRARRRARLRLHLLRHLVPGGDGAARAGAERGQLPGQLHQRDRDRRDDPLPA